MSSHQKQEQRHGPEKKKGAGCAVFAVVLIALAAVLVVVVAFVMIFWVRKAHVAEDQVRFDHAEAVLAKSEATRPQAVDDTGIVVLSEDTIGRISVTDFGNELSREHFIAVVADDHATDLMRRQFAEKANGMRVKWLLRVDDVSAQGSNGQIRAALRMPYKITRGNGWSESNVSVRAEFGPDAVDDLMKVRRGQWVTLEGELALEGSGRGARIVAARVAKRGAEMEE